MSTSFSVPKTISPTDFDSVGMGGTGETHRKMLHFGVLQCAKVFWPTQISRMKCNVRPNRTWESSCFYGIEGDEEVMLKIMFSLSKVIFFLWLSVLLENANAEELPVRCRYEPTKETKTDGNNMDLYFCLIIASPQSCFLKPCNWVGDGQWNKMNLRPQTMFTFAWRSQMIVRHECPRGLWGPLIIAMDDILLDEIQIVVSEGNQVKNRFPGWWNIAIEPDPFKE